MTSVCVQYADFFNATRGGGWAPLLRLAMLAWMLPTDDHSFWEILLGAEPYMPVRRFARLSTTTNHLPLAVQTVARHCEQCPRCYYPRKTQDGFGISNSSQALDHLDRLCPPNRSLDLQHGQTVGEPGGTFSCAEIWQAIGRSVAPPRSWNAAQRAEWTRLTLAAGGKGGGRGTSAATTVVAGSGAVTMLNGLYAAVIGATVISAVTVLKRKGCRKYKSNAGTTAALLPSMQPSGDGSGEGGAQDEPSIYAESVFGGTSVQQSKQRTATTDPYAVR